MLRKSFFTTLLLLMLSVLSLPASPALAHDTTTQSCDTLHVSLITCDPGPDVYQIFGHTAIRIKNSGSMPFDCVFNYGTFSFSDDFIYKFVKGETDYMLGVNDFKYFMIDYLQRNSSVYEQELNLTSQEKEILLHNLIINAQPAHREYRYNFLYNNCATRPRDIINNITNRYHEQVTWNESGQYPSFRELIHHYGVNYSWLLFGIDLALGRELDNKAAWQEQMFVPLILQEATRQAHITMPDGSTRPLITHETTLYDSGCIPVLPPTPWYLTPLFVTIILLLATVLITWHDMRRHCLSRWYDTVINAVFFITSVILYFLIFCSEHPATSININALWATPLAILPVILIWIKKAHNILSWYYKIHLLLLSLFIVPALCGLQYINIAVYPLIILSGIRAVNYIIYNQYTHAHE